MRRAVLLALALIAPLAPRARAAPLRVATLTSVLTEVAREVGGGDAQVVGIVGPGVDPHSFNPSPADIRALVDADLVLASGLRLETYLDRLVANSGTRGPVVAVGDELPAALVMRGREGGEADPHWWNSVADMLAAVEIVRSAFARARPESAPHFGRNARAYSARLRELADWAMAQGALLPPGRRRLVTSHDAFGYLARDLGLSVESINGPSTDSEVDAARLARLVDLVRRERIRTVFPEGSANPGLVAHLLDETGASLGGTLYADGLGPRGSGAEDYFAMYRHNLRAIVEGLSVPRP